MARTLNQIGLLDPKLKQADPNAIPSKQYYLNNVYTGNTIQPTPRNEIIGVLADAANYTMPKALSSVPDLLNEMSYGEMPYTGTKLTTRVDPRTLDFLDVIPFAGIIKGAEKTAKVLSKPSLLSADKYIDRTYRNFPEFKEAYKKIDKNIAPETSMGGRLLNTDVARELFPEYVQNRTRSSDVHEGASTFTKELYADKLRNPTPEGYDKIVSFTAGGTGAGKSSGTAKYTTKAEMIYDTNMSTFGSAKQKIDDALDAGRGVEINYVYRDPVEALKNGSLTRAKNQSAKWGTGRTVPLKEHLKTHAGARDVIEKVAKEYFDDPRVKIRLIDNSGVKSKPVTFDKLPKIDENKVSKELKEALDDMYKNNIITKEIYEGSK